MLHDIREEPSLVLNGVRCEGEAMFDITCDTCSRRYLVGARSIRSFRNTVDGPVVVAACPAGHLAARAFRDRVARPAGPRTPAAAA
jgi:hypothetical protein